ncbi:hypothetical protein [Hydrogenophaga sp.]|uniref:hypothetical protein n=1 Tax=Hydrogenophaga sp. TaxID=1904254 RepID=UPI002ABB610C|nr:hypothetical protein [Hydrogenophaga sp.]MDZ4145878.1 hypothetical protein [Burkholderiales bacterium]MDZ4396266.1 hypothetical protein [Hydrogenophaga sp.]
MSVRDVRLQDLSCKSSILEVCGWVEQAMDTLVLESAQRCNLNSTLLNRVKKNYIDKTFGLQYSKHFEKMLIAVIGYRSYSVIEVDPIVAPYLPGFESLLSDLSKQRNHYAHTHYISQSPYPVGYSAIDAPSIMKSKVSTVENILQIIETKLISCSC